jgi:hypothetical protein
MTVHVPRRAAVTHEQACALHLLDLCRAYPRDPAAPPATAMLEAHRIRGAEARRQDALKVAQTSERSAAPARLAAARRKLVG